MTCQVPRDLKVPEITDVDRNQNILNLGESSDPGIMELNEYADQTGSKDRISITSRSVESPFGTSMPP